MRRVYEAARQSNVGRGQVRSAWEAQAAWQSFPRTWWAAQAEACLDALGLQSDAIHVFEVSFDDRIHIPWVHSVKVEDAGDGVETLSSAMYHTVRDSVLRSLSRPTLRGSPRLAEFQASA